MTCDYERLARVVLADADAIDSEEDERFGTERGDELPERLGRAKVARSGWPTPSAAWNSEACGRRDRFRRPVRRDCARPEWFT